MLEADKPLAWLHGEAKTPPFSAQRGTRSSAKLEADGWRLGTAADFLELTPEEASFVDTKLELSRRLCHRRMAQSLSQSAGPEVQSARRGQDVSCRRRGNRTWLGVRGVRQMVFDRTEATDLSKTKDGAPGPNPLRTHFGEGQKEELRDGTEFSAGGRQVRRCKEIQPSARCQNGLWERELGLG